MTSLPAVARRSSVTFLCAFVFLVGVTTALMADVKLSNQVKLVPTSPPPFKGEGYAVAISGTTAVVGAPFGVDDTNLGVAHVYVFNGVSWKFQATLFPSESQAFDWYGATVDISGETILVGAPFAASKTGDGAVFVFERTGSIWNQTAKLESPVDFGGDTGFGGKVALDADTAVVGDWGDQFDEGHLLVFSRINGVWDTLNPFTIKQILPDPGSSFGSGLDIQGDFIVAGAPDEQWGPFDHKGIVEIFKRNGAAWDDFGLLNPSAGKNDNFGKSVAIDGEIIVVGAPLMDGVGGAYVFHRNVNGFWTTNITDFTLLPHQNAQADAYFGGSVTKSGNNVIVGEDGRDGYVGAAYTYDDLTGTAWGTKNVSGAMDSEQYGWSVALDGTRAVVGANGATAANPGGVAYASEIGKFVEFPRFNWTFILWPYKYIYMGCPLDLVANSVATIAMDRGRLPLSFDIGRAPRNGSLRFVNATTLEYRPNRGFTGRDIFTVKVTDQSGLVLEKTANVTVVAAAR